MNPALVSLLDQHAAHARDWLDSCLIDPTNVEHRRALLAAWLWVDAYQREGRGQLGMLALSHAINENR